MKTRNILKSRALGFETFETRSYLAAHIAGNSASYATIQAAVDAASPGAVINVDAGTYNETVLIYKSLTLRGAQAGVDARNTRGAETHVYATQTVFDIYANDVTIDGFTIEGNRADIGAKLGAGVLMRPSIHGTHVYNSIIQNNVTGIYLSNNSNTDAAIIQHNLIQNNFEKNNTWTKDPGENGSRGIYTDGTVSGGYLTNALIDANRLFNSDFSGGDEDMGMISLQALTAGKQFNITITNNYIGNESKALLATNVTNLVFMGNTCTGLQDGPSGPVRFEGNSNTVNIQYNTITGNAGPGVAVDSAGVEGDSSGFVVNNNNIYGNNSKIGVIVMASVYNGPLYTLGNWWGAASGPGGLGTGTGSQVWGNGKTGHGVTATGLTGGGPVYFSPWATALINITNIPVPATPTGLTAAGLNSTSVVLNWTPQMSTAASQTIQRSSDGGVTFVTVAVVPPLLNAYTDSGLTSGKSYVYRVVASNATGNSAPSATATANPPAYQPPVAPTGLAVTATSGSTATLQWALPSNANGIASYTVYRNGVAVGTSTSLTFTDYGLTSSTTYSYAVATNDTTGVTSAKSSAVNATTSAAQFGDGGFETSGITSYAYNPTNSYWAFSAASGIEANGSSWGAANAPEGTHAGFFQKAGTISQTINVGVAGTYTVSLSAARRANYAVDPITILVDGKTLLTITPAANSFTSYTTASFALTAGSHTFTIVGTATTADSATFVDKVSLNLVASSTPPSTPSSLTAYGSSTTQVILSWITSGATPTTFTLLRSTDNVTFTTVTTTIPGTATGYADATGLVAGTTYYYKLVAVSAAGSSAASNVASAKTLSASATSKSLSSLNWASATSGWNTVQKNSSIAGNTITLKGKTYASGIGTHAASTIVYNLAGAYTLFQSDIGVDDEVGSTKVAAVDFQVYGDGVLLYDSGVLSRTSATVSISVPIAGVQTLTLVAANGIAGDIDNDHADWAGAALVANPVPPAAPTTVSAAGLTTTSIQLAWAAGTGATGYTIERSLDNNTWAPLTTVAGSVLSYSDTGLTNGTTYYYRVRATNAAGSSANSAVVSAKPLAATAVTTQLSSLNWASATAGYGSVQKNLNASGDAINLGGTVYASGVGTHADSTIVYNLAGAYSTFQSDIGFDYRSFGKTSDAVHFQVIGDGKVLYDSGSMTNADAFKSISIDVTGITTLTLVANAVVPGNIDYCHVDWAGASLISA